MQKSKLIAAFIITFNRPETLERTIKELLSQTLPPELILIIDNSTDEKTKEMVARNNSPKLMYYSMGENAGPAASAAKGLSTLHKMGFKWILWQDDDDPPLEKHYNKNLILTAKKIGNNIGIIGTVGTRLNPITGLLNRILDEELEKTEFVDVDLIGGGHHMIINSEVIDKNCLPNPELFFGFEELDFCLKVKRKDYKVIVPSKIYLQKRARTGRLGLSKNKEKSKQKLTPKSFWREYYSFRNLIYIFLHENLKLLPFLITTFRGTSKSVFFLFKYPKLSKLIILGLKDGIVK